MVRSSATKVVHFEEDHQQLEKASMNSGIYNLEDRIGEQDTFDDSIATQESCDAKENPTQLYLRLHYRLWDMVLSTLQSKPADASIWISTKGNKVLPLHVACESSECPPSVVEALMTTYRGSLECPTSNKGSLPLHLICANDHFLATHEALVLKMVDACPRALKISNHNHQTPLQVLRKHLCSSQAPNQCQTLLAKMEEKLAMPAMGYNPPREKPETSRRAKSTTITPTIVSSPSADASDEGFVSRLNKMATPSADASDEGFASRLNKMATPSADASDEGFASRLNKIALMAEDKIEPEAVSPIYRPSSLDSLVNLKPAKPIRDGSADDRDHLSSLRSKDNGGGAQFREQVMGFSEDSSSEDESPQQLTPRSMSQVKLKLTKTTVENGLLRKKLSNLTQKTTSLQFHHDNQCTLIGDLQQSIEQERGISKTYVKDYELKLARLQDQLLDTQRQLQNNSGNEQHLAHRISQLESSMAGKKADLSTLKAAMEDEEMNKATLEEDMEQQKSDNQTLKHQVTAHTRDKERLMVRLEDMTKEVETYKEIGFANTKNIKELSDAFQQKEIQCRSLTGSMGAAEKRSAQLEKLNTALKTKATDLMDVLKCNTDTFKATIAHLESSLQKKEADELETLKKVEELKHVFQAKDKQLEQLTSERKLLESTCETLRKKEIVAEEVAKELASVTAQRDQIRTQLQAKRHEIERLSGETKGLQVESAQKSGTIDESDRRMEALYTELVAQRKRETGLAEKNTNLSRKVEEQTREQQNKAIKLRVLKTAVDSYKSEMERFVVQKSRDDKVAVANVKKLLEVEERLGAGAVNMAELTSKLTALEQREKDANVLAQDYKQHAQEYKQKAQETAAELEEVCTEAEQTRKQLEEQLSSRKQETQQHEKFKHEHKELVEKQKTKDSDYKQLQAVYEQKTNAEEEVRAECTKVQEYNCLQVSLVEDLEVNLSELRSKHAAMCEEHKQMKRIAEKREGLNQTRILDARSARTEQLEACISELKESKAQETKRIQELEVINDGLREWYSNALTRVTQLEETVSKDISAELQEDITRLQRIIGATKEEAILSEDAIIALRKANAALQEDNKDMHNRAQRSQDMDPIQCLTLINCDNLLRIKALSEQEAWASEKLQRDREKWQAEETAFNVKIKDMAGTLKNLRDNYEDLCDELAENTRTTTEMRKHLESSEDKERKQSMQLKSYEQKIGLLETEMRKRNDKDRIIVQRIQLKSYEGKIELLESTITQLQATLGEQKEAITLRGSMTDEQKIQLKSYEGKIDLLENTITQLKTAFGEQNKVIALRGSMTDEQRIQLKSYEAKIDLLENTITQLQTTSGEQNELITLKGSMADELIEERALLKKSVDTLTEELQRSQVRCDVLQKRTQELQACISLDEAATLTVAGLETSLATLHNELEVYREECKRYEDLSNSHQLEVGRLLKINATLYDECQEIGAKSKEQTGLVKELRKCKEEYEKLSAESSMKLLDILSKFSPDAAVSELMQQKVHLQREHEKISEDNVANTANVKYLVTNIQLLETRVMELTLTHKLLVEESEGLRNTITEQEEQIVELADISDRLAAFHEDELAESSKIASAASHEWDKQIIDIVSRYTGAVADQETVLKIATADRTATRERMCRRVTEAFESQSTNIKELHDKVKTTEAKVADSEKKLKDSNYTLKLENKILKTAGKEESERASKAQATLKTENETLKQAISKLTQQTADHQYMICKLAAKQASLQRKKEAARAHDKKKDAHQLKPAPSEDMGSLRLSADSHDVVDGCAVTALSTANNRTDRSVEVVLVDESRDDRALA